MLHHQKICNKQKKYNILAILSKDTQCGSHNDLGLYYCCLNVQNLMVNVLLLYSSLVFKDGFNFLWCKASRVKRCFSPLVVDPIISMFLWSIVTLQFSMCVLTGPFEICSEKRRCNCRLV